MNSEKKTSRKSNDTEKLIRNTARTLFFKNGIDETSVRQIAANSNTNLGSFTYYYKSKNELVEKIFEDVNNEIRALFVTPFEREATLHEYMMMQMFQFKAAILNDRYYELFMTSMTGEQTLKSIKDLYSGCNMKFSRHNSTDSAYFIMTSALLIGMKLELIKLARDSATKEITLEKCLDFFVYEFLDFINPTEIDDMDAYRKQLLQEFDTYYIDIVKEFTPILVKIPKKE